MNTAKRKKLAAARDAKFMKGVHKLSESFKGLGIWFLFHTARMALLRLMPPSVLPKKRPPRSSHCGSVERLAFPRRDNRNPWHPQHNDLHHAGAICDCMGHGHSRKALKPWGFMLSDESGA